MLQNIGVIEIAIVLVLLVLFVGGSRLPIFGRGLGQAKNEFKRGLTDSDETKPAAHK